MQNRTLTDDERAEVEALRPYCEATAQRFGLDEDAAQDAALDLCEAIVAIRGRVEAHEIRAYLTGVAWNKLCDLSKARTQEAKRRRPMPHDLAAPSPVEAPDLLDAIPNLVDRDVAHRVWVEGQSIREVARARGSDHQTIRGILARVAARLRRAAA